jgi:hypothetical protein
MQSLNVDSEFEFKCSEKKSNLQEISEEQKKPETGSRYLNTIKYNYSRHYIKRN